MSYDVEGVRNCLKYKLTGSSDSLLSWGHEYVRHLSAEIIEEFNVRYDSAQSSGDLLSLALEMVPFLLKHNAEADACDLLMELEALEKLPAFLDADTYKRVTLYLTRFLFFTAHDTRHILPMLRVNLCFLHLPILQNTNLILQLGN